MDEIRQLAYDSCILYILLSLTWLPVINRVNIDVEPAAPLCFPLKLMWHINSDTSGVEVLTCRSFICIVEESSQGYLTDRQTCKEKLSCIYSTVPIT